MKVAKIIFLSLFGKKLVHNKIKGFLLDPLNPNLIHPHFCLPLKAWEHTNVRRIMCPHHETNTLDMDYYVTLSSGLKNIN